MEDFEKMADSAEPLGGRKRNPPTVPIEATISKKKKTDLLGLRLLFEWTDQAKMEGRDMQWIREEVIEKLQARVWMAAKDE